MTTPASKRGKMSTFSVEVQADFYPQANIATRAAFNDSKEDRRKKKEQFLVNILLMTVPIHYLSMFWTNQ